MGFDAQLAGAREGFYLILSFLITCYNAFFEFGMAILGFFGFSVNTIIVSFGLPPLNADWANRSLVLLAFSSLAVTFLGFILVKWIADFVSDLLPG